MEAVKSRISVRSFLPDKPVEMSVVRELLELSSRAPSGGNTQPWHVYCLSGEAKNAVSEEALQAASNGIMEEEGTTFRIYPPNEASAAYLDRRRRLGFEMFRLLGVERNDAQGRKESFLNNFRWFGAPIGLIITVDNIVDKNGWGHVGMFLSTLCILAEERGLATCCQEVWSRYPKTLARLLGIPLSEQTIWCGVSLGYADRSAPVNTLRSERVPVNEFATFVAKL